MQINSDEESSKIIGKRTANTSAVTNFLNEQPPYSHKHQKCEDQDQAHNHQLYYITP